VHAIPGVPLRLFEELDEDALGSDREMALARLVRLNAARRADGIVRQSSMRSTISRRRAAQHWAWRWVPMAQAPSVRHYSHVVGGRREQCWPPIRDLRDAADCVRGNIELK
jgi:hypothetical protein